MFTPWKRFLRSKLVWLCLLVIVIFGLVAALAPWLSPHDPYRWNYIYQNLPPMWVKNDIEIGLNQFPLGTDRFGRDILTRLLYGTRTAFILALIAVPIAAILGTIAGFIAGYTGHQWGSVIMLFTDIIQALPGIMFIVILILIFRSFLAPTWVNGMITLVFGYAAVSWVSLARLMRIEVIKLKSRLFVEAAASLGASQSYIILHHLLPNVLYVILVWIINNIPAVILLEALLGYIGVGVTGATDGGEFTVVSWGGLFYTGRSTLSHNPFILFLPSLCLMLISMSFILLADFINGISRQE